LLAAAPAAWRPTRKAADVVLSRGGERQDALDEIAADWTRETRGARSPTPAPRVCRRQIEEGAPAEVFVSADLD
jgi:ABC-type molybdate transport system substrate-binding protein